jgi:hypothetical protein
MRIHADKTGPDGSSVALCCREEMDKIEKR